MLFRSFCCLEALQNVQKYAQATQAEIRLGERDGVVTFEVQDNGIGFDPATAKQGTGMTNMADRLDALGGELELSGGAGAMKVTGRLPVLTAGGAGW